MKRLVAVSLGSLLLALLLPISVSAAEFEKYAIASADAFLSDYQAGAHADLTTSFRVTQKSSGAPFAQARDVTVNLPPGLLGNPTGVPQCSVLQLGFTPETSHCPQDAQVGVTEITIYNESPTTFTEPIYNMEPPGGDTVARLGFMAVAFRAFIDVKVRSATDYGVTAAAEGIPSFFPLIATTTTIWGVPADPSHDALRLTPMEGSNRETPPGGERASTVPPRSFLTNPSRCGVPLDVSISTDSYQLPAAASMKEISLSPLSGCEKLGFQPKLSVKPSHPLASAPTGLNADLQIPQDETPNGLASSPLREATVILPEGMTIAPGAADGLVACSDAEVGYEQSGPPHCPAAAKLGGVEIDVPALEHPLHGSVYQRTPTPGDPFRIWVIADELGVHVKIPGDVRANASTGQLTSIFDRGTAQTEGLPQVPVADLKFHFFDGARAPLANPPACGTYQTLYEFIPWSGTAPVVGDTPMTIDQRCDTGGFAPGLSAGTANPAAGRFSPFVLDVTRKDGEQNLASLDLTMPPGLLASLRGIPLCEGAAAETGDCPPASQIGRVLTAVGPGPAPLWVPQPRKDPLLVYLGGPYKGAPLSIVVRAPAQAGPFDLGTIIVRSAIYVDPETARVRVKSDVLPQIIEGIPLNYRHILVSLDRADFTLNPTNCEVMAIGAGVTSSKGKTASLSSRFQTGGCRGLGFKPRLFTRLYGETHRGAHPRFRAVLEMPSGDANIAGAQVTLPHSEFLDNAHIRTICTRVQFGAHECPAGSIYGYAVAKTPLLGKPLRGPVYLRSSSHKLPDLVVALRGQIEIDLDGRIDSVNGGIRTTFETVPDAPVSRFVLTLKGGKQGLLVNSTNLCTKPSRVTANFLGQNGKLRGLHPRMNNACTKRDRTKRKPYHRKKY